MSGLFYKAIKGDRGYLVKTLNPSGLWESLEDKDVLSSWQIKTCQAEKTLMDQVSKMLDQLERRDDAFFIPFCKILIEDNQREVATKLAGKVGLTHMLGQNAPPPTTYRSAPGPSQSTTKTTPVNTGKCPLCGDRHNPGFPWKFRCFINANRLGYIEGLSVGGNFYAALQQSGVLSNVAIAEIQSKGDEFSQKRELLQKLEKCDDQKYNDFLDVLERSDQSAIARLISDHFTSQADSGSTDRAAVSTSTTNPTSRIQNVAVEEIENYPEDSFDVSVSTIPRTTEEFYQANYKQAFPMTSKPRGTALIFNILQTAGLADRDGTNTDRDNLVKLFQKLHFTVKVYNDVKDNGQPEPERVKPTARNILKLIKTTMDGMASDEQCFIVVTLSHGDINKDQQEVIFGCDGNVITKKQILDVIADENNEYPDLKEIPRLVFFQCCRGEKQMEREGTDCSDVRKNTLYCHSCTRDYVSYRNPVLGTRFVRAMVDTFSKHAHDTDIVGLMNKVKEAMRKIDPKKRFDQVPQHIYDGIFNEKKLYFFP